MSSAIEDFTDDVIDRAWHIWKLEVNKVPPVGKRATIVTLYICAVRRVSEVLWPTIASQIECLAAVGEFNERMIREPPLLYLQEHDTIFSFASFCREAGFTTQNLR